MTHFVRLAHIKLFRGTSHIAAAIMRSDVSFAHVLLSPLSVLTKLTIHFKIPPVSRLETWATRALERHAGFGSGGSANKDPAEKNYRYKIYMCNITYMEKLAAMGFRGRFS